METIARIEDKIDKLVDGLSELRAAIAVLVSQRADDMRRVKDLEDAVRPLKEQITKWKAVAAFAVGLPGIAEVVKWLVK